MAISSALCRCLSSRMTGYAKFYSGSHNAVIRVYDDASNVIETTVVLFVEECG
jgi:hypothetical protein